MLLRYFDAIMERYVLVIANSAFVMVYKDLRKKLYSL